MWISLHSPLTLIDRGQGDESLQTKEHSTHGTTHYLIKAGILKIKKDDNKYCRMLCYVFDRPLGDTKQVILLGLQTVMQAGINVLAHMQDSVNG